MSDEIGLKYSALYPIFISLKIFKAFNEFVLLLSLFVLKNVAVYFDCNSITSCPIVIILPAAVT